MPSPFLDLPAAEIHQRIAAVAREAAGAPVVVRVGDEAYGYRNVGVDLPRAKNAKEGRLQRLRVRTALEAARVAMAESAIAPRVGGTLCGHVQVTTSTLSTVCGDAAHLGQGPLSAGAG